MRLISVAVRAGEWGGEGSGMGEWDLDWGSSW